MKHLQSYLFIIGLFIFSSHTAYAATSTYRSANWVSTDGETTYTSISNCQRDDQTYCSHSSSGFSNLYFGSFGKLSDFGIPYGSILTQLHLRIKGRNSVGQYIGLTQGKNVSPFLSQCQRPFDLWQILLGDTDSTVFLDAPINSSNGLLNCLTADSIDSQNFTFRVNYSSPIEWTSDIDNFQIAFDYNPPASLPTPTSLPSPTPEISSAPVPFLDLPWDYRGKGLTFSEAALSINSYFDHEYPFLCCHLFDPVNLTIFDSKKYFNSERQYSSHDGYDYGSPAGIEDGDAVLAAAGGEATVVLDENSGGAGNEIKIDHGNGYMTVYEHMYNDQYLAVREEDKKVLVKKGQRIGTVGHSGNCWILGKSGRIHNTPSCAHIHFGVIQDKNQDGNFKDNLPDGLTDPYGWQSFTPDPWENYSFYYNDTQRTGNKSYYLWTQKIDSLDEDVPANGGIFSLGKYRLEIPSDVSTETNLKLEMEASPLINPSASLQSLTPPMSIMFKNSLGESITTLAKPFYLQIDYSNIDISRFKLGSIRIYSSKDQIHWDAEDTSLDEVTKKASTQADHLTYFALMGEPKDIVPPTTTMNIHGAKGEDNWYRSDVLVDLFATDSVGESPSGIEYTLYKEDDKEWQTYESSLKITKEGKHTISYYSSDNDGNIEDVKTIQFNLDKSTPEAKIYYDLNSYDIKVLGLDNSASNVAISNSSLRPVYTVRDRAGNVLILTFEKVKLGKQVLLSLSSMKYNAMSPITLENNIFFTLVAGSTQQIDQYYSLKGDKKIYLAYSSLTNSTQIYTRIPGTTSYSKETKKGIALLQLETKLGTLKYSY